ncbi:hypothetical protein LJC61_05145 [Ruminococcaceae bacterium OttesenSCG-928-A16]|nr:hypothetical protein [Ruminococcaceae bacterium OttesenSCG-928-A16]
MKAMVHILLVLFIGLVKLAAKLRLLIPLAYVLIAGTVFHEWATTHEPLPIGILAGLILLSLGSWAITIVRKVKG